MSDERKGPAHPHDGLFKLLLEQPGIARALLRERLPKPLAEKLTEDEPELMPGSFVGERLAETRSDRVLRRR